MLRDLVRRNGETRPNAFADSDDSDAETIKRTANQCRHLRVVLAPTCPMPLYKFAISRVTPLAVDYRSTSSFVFIAGPMPSGPVFVAIARFRLRGTRVFPVDVFVVRLDTAALFLGARWPLILRSRPYQDLRRDRSCGSTLSRSNTSARVNGGWEPRR